jgi:hypothetical protein
MPIESLVVSICVVAIFVIFAAVLAWGDRQTGAKQQADQSGAKRRAF